jgi:hypothetical protein
MSVSCTPLIRTDDKKKNKKEKRKYTKRRGKKRGYIDNNMT